MLFNKAGTSQRLVQGATSYLTQGLTVGFKNVDCADVLFDTFGTRGSSAIADGLFDAQFNCKGPILGVAIYNKDIGSVVAQATSNYLTNRAADFQNHAARRCKPVL